jgi:hypothetical protein
MSPVREKNCGSLAIRPRNCYSKKMKIATVVVCFVSIVGWGSAVDAACTSHPLFHIERSKNKNIVQYDICVSDDDKVSDPNPVKVYWILKNGAKQDLSFIQAKLAYGIESQARMAEDKIGVILTPLKDRQIIVQKIEDAYKAVLAIAGKASILDRVYVKSEERSLGLPKVIYIDLFGRTLETGASVAERLSP